MVDSSEILKGMEVLDSTGAHVGLVDRSEPGGLKLMRRDAPDGQHHHVPLAWVERVDTHVHLNRTAAAVFAAGTAGSAGSAAPLAAARKVNWLAWAALIAGLLALLLFGLRSCDRKTVTTTTSGAAGEALPVTKVTLPGGRAIDVSPNTLNYELQAYLASETPAPRRFAFDKLNFDSGSATIRDEDRATVETLGDILAAYPNAKVRLIGFTDAIGSAAANMQLGGERAKAVAAALTAKGIDAGRIETATGGASDPAASNANGDGRAENRRTELEVAAK